VSPLRSNCLCKSVFANSGSNPSWSEHSAYKILALLRFSRQIMIIRTPPQERAALTIYVSLETRNTWETKRRACVQLGYCRHTLLTCLLKLFASVCGPVAPTLKGLLKKPFAVAPFRSYCRPTPATSYARHMPTCAAESGRCGHLPGTRFFNRPSRWVSKSFGSPVKPEDNRK